MPKTLNPTLLLDATTKDWVPFLSLMSPLSLTWSRIIYWEKVSLITIKQILPKISVNIYSNTLLKGEWFIKINAKYLKNGYRIEINFITVFIQIMPIPMYSPFLLKMPPNL